MFDWLFAPLRAHLQIKGAVSAAANAVREMEEFDKLPIEEQIETVKLEHRLRGCPGCKLCGGL